MIDPPVDAVLLITWKANKGDSDSFDQDFVGFYIPKKHVELSELLDRDVDYIHDDHLFDEINGALWAKGGFWEMHQFNEIGDHCSYVNRGYVSKWLEL